MSIVVVVVVSVFSVVFAAAFAVFAVVSVVEGERRAARVALAAAGAFLVFGGGVFLPDPWPTVFAGAIVAAVLLGAVLWFLPIGRSLAGGGRPDRRIDERDIMFARARLKPGSERYDAYYAMRPENRVGDDKTHSLPGLLSPDAELAEPFSFAAADAYFDITEALRDEVDGEVCPQQVDLASEEWTARLKALACHSGAVSVGICQLQPYHIYSHVGRGVGGWGEAVSLDHRWAIAFSVEMDHRTMTHAPAGPAVAESGHQYVESAKIGVHLASVIRRCGWRARAHIDGNYRVIAPLVARDAGLGEIGRMGLLMTPELGPRVRLGVVTTDVPLIPDSPGDDLSVLDFCAICRKCADTCPVGAIPAGDRTPIGESGLRWAIDDDTCFRYWNVVGTDCGRCMSVCPYSHPDNAAHNVVRWAIKHSGVARRAMLRMDDGFYGRHPNPRESSRWPA